MKRGEFDDLVAFAAIARTRSFTRAAAELNLSPSALSHAMKALETRVGVQLLARTTRSVSPTPAGERLLSSLEPALNEVENGLAAMGNWRGTPSGTIRLTTSRHGAHTTLSSALPRFLLAYPDISVEVVVDSKLTDLVKDGFDAGIRFGHVVDQDMLAIPVGPPERSVIVGSPDYFDQHPRPETPMDLDHHNCINYRYIGGGGLASWDFERDGREIRVRPPGQLIVNDRYLAAAAILAGAGLGFMLEDHASPYLSSGQLIQVLEDWCAPFPGLHMYYPNRQVTPALRALIEALRWKG